MGTRTKETVHCIHITCGDYKTKGESLFYVLRILDSGKEIVVE
jgi:hypothetical protein